MDLLTLLLGINLIVVAFIAWRLLSSGGNRDREDAKVLREMFEHLRRDVADTKDKLHKGMGDNAEKVQVRLEKMLDVMSKQLGGMDQRVDKRVGEINQRLDAAAKLMSMVQKQYGTVEEISGSIKQLQEAFKTPKLRGGFGEKTLVDLVRQVLPIKSYAVQHTFRSGAIVDLLVRTANGGIAIDAKFPLENYLRLVDDQEDEKLRKAFGNDVKKHIRDIAKKYILPEEGTLEFALMYVPSDTLWHEILMDGELSDLAESVNVHILSPHSFYYFLNVIRLAYQSQTFEENAKQVLALIRGVQQQSGKLGEDLQILQRHMVNASAKLTDVHTGYVQLDTQVKQAAMIEKGGLANEIKQEAAQKTMKAGKREAQEMLEV